MKTDSFRIMSTTITPYLSFNGNTREVFAFYEKALGAKIQTMLRYADMPAPPPGAAGPGEGCPPPTSDAIMHACLAFPGGAMLFAGVFDRYPRLKVGSVELFNLLGQWAPDDATRRRILVDNPQALFGFSESRRAF